MQSVNRDLDKKREIGYTLCLCACVCVRTRSIETAKQKLESDRLHREAESRKRERRKKLVELRNRFETLLQHNQSLPEHVRLQRSVTACVSTLHEWKITLTFTLGR